MIRRVQESAEQLNADIEPRPLRGDAVNPVIVDSLSSDGGFSPVHSGPRLGALGRDDLHGNSFLGGFEACNLYFEVRAFLVRHGMSIHMASRAAAIAIG